MAHSGLLEKKLLLFFGKGVQFVQQFYLGVRLGVQHRFGGTRVPKG
jgi:hypothetical protein